MKINTIFFLIFSLILVFSISFSLEFGNDCIDDLGKRIGRNKITASFEKIITYSDSTRYNSGEDFLDLKGLSLSSPMELTLSNDYNTVSVKFDFQYNSDLVLSYHLLTSYSPFQSNYLCENNGISVKASSLAQKVSFQEPAIVGQSSELKSILNRVYTKYIKNLSGSNVMPFEIEANEDDFYSSGYEMPAMPDPFQSKNVFISFSSVDDGYLIIDDGSELKYLYKIDPYELER
ncbi:MAG: hypothetical protein ABIA04_00525 [Pseudomonadota bacterium]